MWFSIFFLGKILRRDGQLILYLRVMYFKVGLLFIEVIELGIFSYIKIIFLFKLDKKIQNFMRFVFFNLEFLKVYFGIGYCYGLKCVF